MPKKLWSSKPPPVQTIQRGHPLARGLIGAWHLNEGAGTVSNDATGQYGNGAFSGTGITWGSGVVDVASGAANFISIPDKSALYPLTTQFSFEILFRMDALRNYNALIDKTGSIFGDPITSYIDSTGALVFYCVTNPSTISGFVAGVWYHLVLLGQSATINGFQDIYVNGILKGHNTGTPTLTDTGQPLRFFRRSDGATQFGGNVSHVRLWNRILEPAEIQALYVNNWLPITPRHFVVSGFTPPGPTQTLQPLSIDAHRALGLPTLAGGSITMQPLSIMAHRALGTPTINNVQILKPTSITAHRAIGTPTIKGSTNYMRPDSLAAHRVMGTPTLVGGETYLQIFVGGYNRTPWAVIPTASLDSQTLGRWTARLQFMNVPFGATQRIGTTDDWTPLIGQTILIQEFGRKYFAGCIASIEAVMTSGVGLIKYDCQALDKTSICDHRIIPPVTFTAGQDAADVIRFVVATYLAGEGILPTGVPATMGALDSDIPVNFWTVTALFDYIQTLTGYQWYVDINGILTWATPSGALAAPFNISTSSLNYMADQNGDSTLRVTSTLLDYRNKQYVVSNRNVLPGDGSTPTTASRDETFTLPYAPSVAAGLVFGSVITSLPILQITGVTVNGISKTPHTYLYETPPVNNDFFWSYFPGNIYVTAPIAGADIPSPGDVVVISYIPFSQQAVVMSESPLVVVTPPLPPPGEGFGTCGSGIYESVEQVTDVVTQNDLDAIAAGLITRSGIVPLNVRYRTQVPGLYVGMKQNANVPAMGLVNVDLFITGVSGRSLGINLGHDSSFEWEITAANTQDQGNWQKWWERLVKRTRFPKPLTVVDAASFVLAPGSSLSAGTNLTNPLEITASGRLAEVTAVTDNPPTDQDLIIAITYNGATIFQSGGELTVPDGNSSVQSTSTFIQPNFYVFKGGLVRISVSYRVTGSDPVPAQSVSVKMRVEV